MFTVTVVINKQKNKVLFAEANTDFVHVLLSLLTLPLGKVVTILRNHCGEAAASIGGLNTLYTGLFNLHETYFCVRGAKTMLLNRPEALAARCSNNYFVCEELHCTKSADTNISLHSDIATCECGKSLNRLKRVGESVVGGGFTINPSTFIITDDLCVLPISSGIIQTLNNLGIADTQGAELKSLSFGTKEIMELVKFSLTSATPLTDMIIKNTEMSSNTAASPEPGILFHHIKEDDANSRKIVLRVCLQKSTNNFLFAQATGEFVELLFSFLTVPLGGVEFLLGGKTGLKNIDNLYRSVSNGVTTPESKNRLINPKLPHDYICKNQFLPLSEETSPKLYYQRKYDTLFKRNEYSFHEKDGTLVSSFKSNKENYVNNHIMCIVTDDLTVSPGLATSISILNALGIPLSDVRETELHIGLKEALSILKASLTSKMVITDALINPMLNKEPKLERKRKQEF